MPLITNFYQQALDYLAQIAANYSGGGGGGEASQSTIEAAIEAAENLDQVEPLLQAVRDRLPASLSGGKLLVDLTDSDTVAGSITAQDSGSTSVVVVDGQRQITGTASANSAVVLATSGNSSFCCLVTGTFVGVLVVECSIDGGTTWTRINTAVAGTNNLKNFIEERGLFCGNLSAATHVRVRGAQWTSDTANIRLIAGAGTGVTTIGNAITLFDPNAGVNFGEAFTISPGPGDPSTNDNAIVVAERNLHSHVFHSESLLSAPGATERRSFDGYRDLFVTCTVANINTRVVVRLEGEAVLNGWVNLDPGGDTLIFTNGTYAFKYTGTLSSVRFNFVSEAGGTTATIDVNMRFGK